nr:Chain A, Polyphemusin I [synthetic construct]
RRWCFRVCYRGRFCYRKCR